MKQKTIFLIIMCQFINANAQNFGYKLIGGVNFCQIDGDGLAGYNKLGYRFGVGVTLPVNEINAWGLELTYTLKGTRTANDPDNPGNLIVKYNYSYLEVPVFFQKKIKFFQGKIGLAPGYLIDAQKDLGGGFVTDEAAKKFELSGLLGVNFKLNDKLQYYIQYQYSITSIINRKKAANSTFIRNGVYNNLISMGLNYHFNKQ